MKSLIALIIFADGVAAFIGAIVAFTIRTPNVVNESGVIVKHGHRPVLIKVLMIGLFGYSIARFWNAWNNAANGREVFECVRLVSPRFIWNHYGALGLQAAMAWGATIYLISRLLNGQLEGALARVSVVIGKVKFWKR